MSISTVKTQTQFYVSITKRQCLMSEILCEVTVVEFDSMVPPPQAIERPVFNFAVFRQLSTHNYVHQRKHIFISCIASKHKPT